MPKINAPTIDGLGELTSMPVGAVARSTAGEYWVRGPEGPLGPFDRKPVADDVGRAATQGEEALAAALEVARSPA